MLVRWFEQYVLWQYLLRSYEFVAQVVAETDAVVVLVLWIEQVYWFLLQTGIDLLPQILSDSPAGFFPLKPS